jgi:hypothetical protein
LKAVAAGGLGPTVTVGLQNGAARRMVFGETSSGAGAEPGLMLQITALKLPRFRGHPTFWVEGVHDVEAKVTLPT